MKRKSDPDKGFFSSASGYIRDLIRHDFEADEQRKWDALKQELGQIADESEFRTLSAEQVIAEAKRRKVAGSEEWDHLAGQISRMVFLLAENQRFAEVFQDRASLR